MTFSDRAEAGRLLGEDLQRRNVSADMILGLPRGGVVVAAAIARILNLPLAAIVVRKIGHPHNREFAVGAIAEPDVVVIDQDSLGWRTPTATELEFVQQEELLRLQHYQALFHPHAMPELRTKRVLLVDDGLATGATMEAAARSAVQRAAASVIVAVPVASTQGVARLSSLVDAVIALEQDRNFGAVGRYYRDFKQVANAEVIALLQAGRSTANATHRT